MVTVALAAVAGGLLFAVVVLATLLWVVMGLQREERDHARHSHEVEREAWRSERRELLNRMQFPERMPVATQPVGRRPVDPEMQRGRLREMASVGRVVQVPTVASNGAEDEIEGVP